MRYGANISYRKPVLRKYNKLGERICMGKKDYKQYLLEAYGHDKTKKIIGVARMAKL